MLERCTLFLYDSQVQYANHAIAAERLRDRSNRIHNRGIRHVRSGWQSGPKWTNRNRPVLTRSLAELNFCTAASPCHVANASAGPMLNSRSAMLRSMPHRSPSIHSVQTLLQHDRFIDSKFAVQKARRDASRGWDRHTGCRRALRQNESPGLCRGFMNAQLNDTERTDATINADSTLRGCQSSMKPLWVNCDFPHAPRRCADALLHNSR
jgi:hypothetical protein